MIVSMFFGLWWFFLFAGVSLLPCVSWFKGLVLAEERFCPHLVDKSTVSAFDLLRMPFDQHSQPPSSLNKGERKQICVRQPSGP